VGRGLLLLRRSRSRRRSLGTPAGPGHPERQRPRRRRRYPPTIHRQQARPVRTRQGRPVRQIPDRQGRLPRLPHRPRLRMAHPDRNHRRCLPLPRRLRMDITGARWSVDGAEAVLKLRAVRASDDFDATGASISNANVDECTSLATPTTSSPRRIVPPGEPHPNQPP